jgi:monoamine oxidase
MLPIEKYEAFSNIKLGFYNHILIQFTDSFYKNFNIKKDTYLFSKITTKSLSPIGFFGSLKLHNFNLSYFDVGGGFAEELENAGENAAKDFILELLKSTFGSDIKKYIIKYHVTSWGRNKYFLGSYSSAIPGKSHFREILKTSIDDKIFFAGEAVSSNYGTVHGADATGIYSAEEVMRLI